MSENSVHRFYGRRKGRTLRDGVQTALKEALGALVFNPALPLFPENPNPIWLEIGFGGGEHLLEQLQRHPSTSFLGCEAYQNGVARFVKGLEEKDYARVRIFPDDTRLCLDAIPPHTFSKAFVLFPDPWPKKRHAKRRLIQPAFLDQLSRVLYPAAQLWIASDDDAYIAWIQEKIDQHPGFYLIHQASVTTLENWPKAWPKTRYGVKALEAEKNCTFLIYEKIL